MVGVVFVCYCGLVIVGLICGIVVSCCGDGGDVFDRCSMLMLARASDVDCSRWDTLVQIIRGWKQIHSLPSVRVAKFGSI